MTKLDTMLWDQYQRESVRASKIRSFGIYREQRSLLSEERFKLLGWYNKDEFFHFGIWDTEEEARDYLKNLHNQIERR